MARAAGARGDGRGGDADRLTTADRTALLRYMLEMRGIERRAMNLYRQGKIPGSFYDGLGQEAVSAGAAFAMAAEDRLCVLHRDLAAHLVRGVEPERIFAQYMGRAAGITGGRDGNIHFGDRQLGCVGMVSMLPDMMLVAVGMAMAFRLRGERRCALTWFGDGATSRGDCHEAMNWAGVQRLPVIFVLENNQYAYSTPTELQFAVDPVERAAGYGFPGVTVDGNDVEAMFAATLAARERAIAGERADADLGADDADARARGARRHALRPAGAGRALAGARPDRARGRPPGGARGRRRRRSGRGRRPPGRGAGAALDLPFPAGDTATDGVFCAGEAEPLGDGRAPWSGHA